ncbi:MAG TPA: hypothetical protein PK295_03825 [Candidatus Magasanikbacteria bacterium]|nr:hypothetical protein [Candidatus Magasanikbacteria bacterium]
MEKDLKLQYKRIKAIVDKGDFLNNKIAILDFLNDQNLSQYFFKKLTERTIDLQEAEFILFEILKRKYLPTLDKILEQNISEKNNLYIIEFITENYEKLTDGNFRDSLYQESALEIVHKILEANPSYVEKVLDLVKKVLSLKKEIFKEDISGHSREKEFVGILLLDLAQNNYKVEEIISLVGDSFDLTDGGYGITMNTPVEIFTILKEYLENDFKKNLQKIVKLVVKQYTDRYDFNGAEWAGSGISRMGSHFSLNDIDIITHVLTPATNKFYEKTHDFDFIKKEFITNDEQISSNRPDFLNRATFQILLTRFENGDREISIEAFEILKKFIESKKGIPSKADLIYQLVLNSSLPNDKKWMLAQIDATNENYPLPTSVFLDQLITRLASNGLQEAKQILQKWQSDMRYYQRFVGATPITTAISSQLENDFKNSLELFKDFIKNDGFVNDTYDTFEVYDLARVLTQIIIKDFNAGLDILNDLKNKPTLGKNQQILLSSSISNFDSKDITIENKKEITNRIYNEFLLPFLNTYRLSSSEIAKLITYDNAREQFVKFAGVLVENNEVEKALQIIETFISDTDPYLPKPDSSDSESNEHARISRGEGDPTITSVRGWCGWILMECAVLKGRPYIDKIIDLTEKLTKDDNYYVQHMSCFALSQLAAIRLTHIKDTEQLFLDDNWTKALKKAKRIESIAFNLLEKIASYPPEAKKGLSKSIMKVFGEIRSLNQVDAQKFIDTFLTFPPESIVDAAPLFIFYAEFRKDAYKGWKWKVEGLYDDLETFDSQPFKKILEQLINSDHKEIREQFSFKFSVLPEEGVDLFNTSLYYLNKIADGSYDDKVFNHIYTYFIPRQLDLHFQECYKLWKKCLVKEVVTLNEWHTQKIPNSIPNWIEFYHDQILKKIREVKGDEAFLNDLELFFKLPKNVRLYGIRESIYLLQTFPTDNKKVEALYDSLIERDPIYFDNKELWQKGSNS